MFEISLNVYYTIAIAVLVLLLGDLIKKHVAVLRKFCIPTPVVGGVIFSVAITVLNVSGVCTVSLDSSFNEFFSLLFYAGIGYTASWKLLKKGGLMALALYYGKENGYEERDAILAHLQELDDRTYTVLGCEWMNRKNDPPLPIFIWKE